MHGIRQKGQSTHEHCHKTVIGRSQMTSDMQNPKSSNIKS